ncbi:MAG: glycosyltransferase [Planctomycetales bacterium]|nr:glycosyltransferase [Planctomycetales bacterium]
MQSSSVSHRVRLSVATIVKNDALGLAKTIHSVESLADEIVVVDTGSSDGSQSAAVDGGAKVIDFEWCDDFSAARNEALRYATGDWILWLDAGETISAADAAALREQLQQGLDTNTVYMMVVKPPAAPGLIAAEQIARIRLAPRREGLRFRGRVRESLYEAVDELQMQVEGLPYRLLRGPREHDGAAKLAKAERNARLAELEMDEIGRAPSLLNCLADALQTLGRVEEAVHLYGECLTADKRPSSERLEAYYGLLTCLDQTPGGRPTQLSLCVQALEEFPLDAQLLCAMGGYLQGQGRADLAARSYQTAFEFGRVNPLVWHMEEVTAIAAVCWSLSLQIQEQNSQAMDVLQAAIARDAELPRVRQAMLDLAIKSGDVQRALNLVEVMPMDAQDRGHLLSAARGACLASEKNFGEAAPYLQAAYDAGCRHVVCLRWLTVTAMALGRQQFAVEVLQAWLEARPGDPEPQAAIDSLLAEAKAPAPPAVQAPIETPARRPGRTLRFDRSQPGESPSPGSVVKPGATAPGRRP